MKKTFRLENLCCANCAAKIEDKIAKLPGVSRSTVNFLTGRLTIEAEDQSIDAVLAEAKKIIHKIEPDAGIVEL